MRLSHRDLRGVLEFVHTASSANEKAAFPQPVVESLARLIPGEHVGYHEHPKQWPYSETVAVEVPILTLPPAVVDARRAYCASYPLSNLHRNSETRALTLSDFLSRRELHRLEYYDSVLQPFGFEHQMRLWLPGTKNTVHAFYFNRRQADGDFDDRDRSVLDLLRPIFAAIRERFEFRRVETPAYDDCLTEREAEILYWVARGKTNQEIAALLVVSPHTVRKHLENSYAKLGVHTRTAAVARAFAPRN